MNKRIRFFAVLLLLVLQGLFLFGCWNARELKEIPIVSGIGIDESIYNPKDVTMTVQIVKPGAVAGGNASNGDDSGGNDSNASSSKGYLNVHNSGSSVFEALRNLSHVVNGKLYVAHNHVIIIHRKVAEKGIQPILDYFIREIETRPITDIFISEDKAADILDVKPEIEELPAIALEKLVGSQELTSTSRTTTLQELINYMLSKTTSAVVPIVAIKKDHNKKVFHVEGFAVFEKDRMVGKLDGKESRGLLWVKGEVVTGIVSLQYAGNQVNLEILGERTKIIPKIEDGEITITVKIKHDSTMMEQLSADNLATSAVFEKLQALERETIKSEILSAYEKAKELDADIFGFGELIHKKYPKDWKKMHNDWDALFKRIKLVIEIDNKIRGMGIISKPITEMN